MSPALPSIGLRRGTSNDAAGHRDRHYIGLAHMAVLPRVAVGRRSGCPPCNLHRKTPILLHYIPRPAGHSSRAYACSLGVYDGRILRSNQSGIFRRLDPQHGASNATSMCISSAYYDGVRVFGWSSCCCDHYGVKAAWRVARGFVSHWLARHSEIGPRRTHWIRSCYRALALH